MRLLIIDDDPRFRALLRHHASCRWPHAACVDYEPAARGALAPEIRASGFDAVLLGGPGRLEWLDDLTRRRGFAPIICCGARRGDAAVERARALGAAVVFGRDKIEHDALIAALAAAGERRALAPETADADARRFGSAEIPGYRPVRRLASGPAQLYLAERELDATLVAIKIATGAAAAMFKRFLQEHEIARRIAGRRVVRMDDLGVSGQHAYLVMEYLRAGSLRERMRSPMTTAQALRFALEIARALEAAHHAGVLHRDLKPGNIMLREAARAEERDLAEGSIALIDFGLSQYIRLDGDPMIISGTPHYMSPEQGHGEPIDARSDLYSLGVILYEMLAGRKPYTADNPMTIIYLHRKAPLPALPRPLARLQPLLERLLGKSPADRFESAAAAAAALQQALDDAVTPEGSGSPGAQAECAA